MPWPLEAEGGAQLEGEGDADVGQGQPATAEEFAAIGQRVVQEPQPGDVPLAIVLAQLQEPMKKRETL